jgi:hypothetical protein
MIQDHGGWGMIQDHGGWGMIQDHSGWSMIQDHLLKVVGGDLVVGGA